MQATRRTGKFKPPQARAPSGPPPTASKPPAETWLKVPSGMVQLSVGTPQHVSVWSVLTAHVKPLPEETWLKVPGGALVSPDKLSPQQARVASVRTAHA